MIRLTQLFRTQKVLFRCLILTVWLLGSASLACGQNVQVEMLIDGKKVARNAEGTFVLPPTAMGKEFKLRVTNRNRRRVAVVIGIDGLSIIGKNRLTSNSGGYVLEPFKTYDLKGWRTNDREVQAFKVTSASQSEAAKQGNTSNIGTIHLCVFQDASPQAFVPKRPHMPRQPGPPHPIYGSSVGNSIRKVGTGAGQTIDSQVKSIPFRRGFMSQVKYRYQLIPQNDTRKPQSPDTPSSKLKKSRG